MHGRKKSALDLDFHASRHPNAHAANSDFEFTALSEAKRYRKALLASFGTHVRGEVLEVGAGIGQFTTEINALPNVASVTAVEPDPKFHDILARKLPPERIIKGEASLADPSMGWNSIVSINVLEHIKEDQEELDLYCRLLAARSGALCLFVPARPEIYAQLDRDFGHFRRYRKSELRAKLEHAGFRVTTLRYYNIAGYFAWWLIFLLMRRRRFNPLAVRWFDRLVFPPSSGRRPTSFHPHSGRASWRLRTQNPLAIPPSSQIANERGPKQIPTIWTIGSSGRFK